MKSYAEVRQKTAEALAPADPAEDMLPCRYCGAQAKRKALSMLGARCHPCFEAYQAQGFSGAYRSPTRQAAWVKAAAEAADRARTGRVIVNPFAELAARLSVRNAVPGDMTDDDVNAMLQVES